MFLYLENKWKSNYLFPITMFTINYLACIKKAITESITLHFMATGLGTAPYGSAGRELLFHHVTSQ